MPSSPLITATRLHEWTTHPGGASPPVIIDCRFELAQPKAGLAAYEAAHIPRAHYADLNRDLSAPPGPLTGRHPLPDSSALAAALGRWGATPESQVVVYDDANSSFAARLWWLLRWIGHTEVAVLDGGYQAWRKAGGPLENGVDSADPGQVAGTLIPRPGTLPSVSTAEVAATLLASERLVIDARAPERYAGATEPIDSVAGHVPGAVNHPFSLNLAADNTFLPAVELRRRWLERLGGRDAAQVVAMCGSGVTACHNLLSLEIAGLPGAALYPGSWSEWIRDARRPVARGESP